MNRDIDLEQCRIFSERDVYAAWDNVGEVSMDFKGLHRLHSETRFIRHLKVLMQMF